MRVCAEAVEAAVARLRGSLSLLKPPLADLSGLAGRVQEWRRVRSTLRGLRVALVPLSRRDTAQQRRQCEDELLVLVAHVLYASSSELVAAMLMREPLLQQLRRTADCLVFTEHIARLATLATEDDACALSERLALGAVCFADARDSSTGFTLLHMAALADAVNTTRELCAQGAALTVDRRGRTAPQLAAERGHHSCLALLLHTYGSARNTIASALARSMQLRVYPGHCPCPSSSSLRTLHLVLRLAPNSLWVCEAADDSGEPLPPAALMLLHCNDLAAPDLLLHAASLLPAHAVPWTMVRDLLVGLVHRARFIRLELVLTRLLPRLTHDERAATIAHALLEAVRMRSLPMLDTLLPHRNALTLTPANTSAVHLALYLAVAQGGPVLEMFLARAPLPDRLFTCSLDASTLSPRLLAGALVELSQCLRPGAGGAGEQQALTLSPLALCCLLDDSSSLALLLPRAGADLVGGALSPVLCCVAMGAASSLRLLSGAPLTPSPLTPLCVDEPRPMHLLLEMVSLNPLQCHAPLDTSAALELVQLLLPSEPMRTQRTSSQDYFVLLLGKLRSLETRTRSIVSALRETLRMDEDAVLLEAACVSTELRRRRYLRAYLTACAHSSSAAANVRLLALEKRSKVTAQTIHLCYAALCVAHPDTPSHPSLEARWGLFRERAFYRQHSLLVAMSEADPSALSTHQLEAALLANCSTSLSHTSDYLRQFKSRLTGPARHVSAAWLLREWMCFVLSERTYAMRPGYAHLLDLVRNKEEEQRLRRALASLSRFEYAHDSILRVLKPHSDCAETLVVLRTYASMRRPDKKRVADRRIVATAVVLSLLECPTYCDPDLLGHHILPALCESALWEPAVRALIKLSSMTLLTEAAVSRTTVDQEGNYMTRTSLDLALAHGDRAHGDEAVRFVELYVRLVQPFACLPFHILLSLWRRGSETLLSIVCRARLHAPPDPPMEGYDMSATHRGTWASLLGTLECDLLNQSEPDDCLMCSGPLAGLWVNSVCDVLLMDGSHIAIDQVLSNPELLSAVMPSAAANPSHLSVELSSLLTRTLTSKVEQAESELQCAVNANPLIHALVTELGACSDLWTRIASSEDFSLFAQLANTSHGSLLDSITRAKMILSSLGVPLNRDGPDRGMFVDVGPRALEQLLPPMRVKELKQILRQWFAHHLRTTHLALESELAVSKGRGIFTTMLAKLSTTSSSSIKTSSKLVVDLLSEVRSSSLHPESSIQASRLRSLFHSCSVDGLAVQRCIRMSALVLEWARSLCAARLLLSFTRSHLAAVHPLETLLSALGQAERDLSDVPYVVETYDCRRAQGLTALFAVPHRLTADEVALSLRLPSEVSERFNHLQRISVLALAGMRHLLGVREDAPLTDLLSSLTNASVLEVCSRVIALPSLEHIAVTKGIFAHFPNHALGVFIVRPTDEEEEDVTRLLVDTAAQSALANMSVKLDVAQLIASRTSVAIAVVRDLRRAYEVASTIISVFLHMYGVSSRKDLLFPPKQSLLSYRDEVRKVDEGDRMDVSELIITASLQGNSELLAEVLSHSATPSSCVCASFLLWHVLMAAHTNDASSTCCPARDYEATVLILIDHSFPVCKPHGCVLSCASLAALKGFHSIATAIRPRRLEGSNVYTSVSLLVQCVLQDESIDIPHGTCVSLLPLFKDDISLTHDARTHIHFAEGYLPKESTSTMTYATSADALVENMMRTLARANPDVRKHGARTTIGRFLSFSADDQRIDGSDLCALHLVLHCNRAFSSALAMFREDATLASVLHPMLGGLIFDCYLLGYVETMAALLETYDVAVLADEAIAAQMRVLARSVVSTACTNDGCLRLLLPYLLPMLSWSDILMAFSRASIGVEATRLLIVAFASATPKDSFKRVLDAPMNSAGDTLLLHSVRRGVLSWVQCLLELGADPTIPDGRDMTALRVSVCCGLPEVTQRLARHFPCEDEAASVLAHWFRLRLLRRVWS